jgi:hopanoid biosynthesis associated RND transporter like protein HpnN
MNSLKNNLLARLLERLADAVFQHPRWFVWPQFLLFGLCVFYTVRCLEFDNNRSNLVGADKRYHRNYQEFRKDFQHQDDMVVVVESEDSEKNRQFVERLGAKLEAETNLFQGVFIKGDLKMMGNKALLFVPEDDLKTMQRTLQEYRPFIQKFGQATNLITLFDLINTGFRTAKRETNTENTSLINALPALERIVSQANDSLGRQGTPPSPGVNALFGAGGKAEQQIYITFDNGRLYLVNTHAPNEAVKEKSVERLTALVEQTRAEVPGVNAGVTGEPVLDSDEMRQSQRDSTLASVVSLILCSLIFIYSYRETGRPLKAVLCLIIGVGYTLGFATLVVHKLNILTTSFVPILIGMAIDFGVHLITRYEEELRHGRSEQEAMRKAMVFTGQGIFTGAFTTAGGFLAMGFTDFRGIREMGIICGAGLLICLVPMMTLLPVLLMRGRQNILDHHYVEKLKRRARIEQIWLRRPFTVIGLALVLCALAVSQFSKVVFDYNLLNLQSKGLPAVAWERKLIHSTTKSVIFGVVIANSLEEAARLEVRIKRLPAVSEVQSLSRFLTEDQSRKLVTVGEIKKEAAAMEFAPIDRQPVDLKGLSDKLYFLQGYCGVAADKVGTNEPAIQRQLLSLRDTVHRLNLKLATADPAVAAATLAAFQQALFGDLHDTFKTIATQDNQERLRVQDLPDTLRNRFVSLSGKHLLMVYPKRDPWQRDNQREFVFTLRQALDPLDLNLPVITGPPVQLYEYTGLLRSSCEEAAYYSLLAIVVLVLVHFRSLVAVVLALLPVAIGSIWLGGIMGWLAIPFNPANILILPLVIGIGVTNGIQILNRFAEERNPSILAKSTGKAVLISGLNTIAGFGSLMVGKHQGIASLGYVMAAGTATCLLAALTFLPSVLYLIQKLEKKKQPSAGIKSPALGREEPRRKPQVAPSR